MNLRKTTAAIALATLMLGAAAGPALALDGEQGTTSISAMFSDMGDYEWGLSQVVKMQVHGVLKGRSDGAFAPGEKIQRQETAVAMLRFMEQEAVASALTTAEVDILLQHMPDQAEIAPWARSSVAALVKLGMISQNQPLAPAAETTRLDTAVMLVKAMGLETEAQAKMSTTLAFADAYMIPANLAGYVAVATEHRIIQGIMEGNSLFFFPGHAVKRVEMAVMMGRADGQSLRERKGEMKGTISQVNLAARTLTLFTRGRAVTLAMAEEAGVFVDDVEKGLADLNIGMHVAVKLDTTGRALYVEARRGHEEIITGSISSIQAATEALLALVFINETEYQLAGGAVLTLNGEAVTLTGLQAGDTVRAIRSRGLVIKVEATRAVSPTPPADEVVIEGSIAAVYAGVAGVNTVDSGAQVTIAYMTNGSITFETFRVPTTAEIKVNGQAASLTDLKAGDAVKATFRAGTMTRIEVTR